MKKLKTIRQLDKRPNERNILRAADQLIDNKQYIPTTITVTGRGPGPDAGLIEGCIPSNSETFTRVNPDSLGTSEFGPDWIFNKPVVETDTINTEVNGTQAHFTADDGQISNGTYSVGLWETGITLPIEFLVRFKLRWQKNAQPFWSFEVGPQSGPNWTTSADLSTIVFDIRDDSGTSIFYLEAVESLSFESGFPSFIDILSRSYSGNPDSTWYEFEIWMRYRINVNNVKVRFWETSSSEPGTWQIENSSVPDSSLTNNPYLGMTVMGIRAGSELFGNNSEQFIDSIEVSEGSIDPICDESQTVSLSGLYALQAFGPESPGLATVPGILATLTRIDSTHYDTPTDALYIKDVYIDGVRLGSWMWTFTFDSGRRITFIDPVGSTAEVRARYVPS